MRHAGEELLQSWPNFTSVIGRAEATELPSQGVDFITAAAAFHWFDHARTLPEFQRILKPDGWLVRVANRRRSDLGGMMKAMDDLMKEYRSGNDPDRHSRSEEALSSFYGPAGSATRTCANAQVLDFSGVSGLLLSHSSIPLNGENTHDEMISALRMAFEEHQIDGRVTLQYETRVTFGRLVR
jgi:SAM-dependent methyltransferase